MCEIGKTCTTNNYPYYGYYGCGGTQQPCADATVSCFNNDNCCMGNSNYLNYQNNVMQYIMTMLMQVRYLLQQINQYDSAAGSCPKKTGCDSGCDNDYDTGYDYCDTGSSNSGYRYINEDKNLKSGLSYSAYDLKNVKDGLSNGTKDNKVTKKEYGALAEAADVNDDGYISPGEDLALKYVVDHLDGDFKNYGDGRISKQEWDYAKELYGEGGDSFIKEEVEKVYNDTVNKNGQYLKNLDTGKDLKKAVIDIDYDDSCDSCDKDVSSKELNEYWKSCFGKSYNGAVRYRDDDGKMNSDSGVEKSREILKDKTGNDDIVSVIEYGKFGDVADRTSDSKVSPWEDFALKKVIDVNEDGIITKGEMQNAVERYNDDWLSFDADVEDAFYVTKNDGEETLWKKYQGPKVTAY